MKVWKRGIAITSFVAVYFGGLYHFFCLRLSKDDSMMRAIASGAYTGEPDGHLIFIKYVFGWIISKMYEILSGFNWYGIFIMLIGAVSIFLILYRVSQRKGVVTTLVGYLLTVIVTIPMFMELNFTYSAVFAGSVALFYAATRNDDLTKITHDDVIVSLFLWICYCIRCDIFYIAFVCVLLEIGYRCVKQIQNIKRVIISWLKPGIIFICLFIFAGLIELVAYDGQEWKDYKEYNVYRAEFLDYFDWPDYEQNIDLYQRYGINEANMELLDYTCLAIDDADVEGLIAELAVMCRQEQNSMGLRYRMVSTFLQFYHYFFSEEYAILNILLLLSYLGLILYALYESQEDALAWKYVGGLALYILMWLYLIFKGRIIFRACASLQVIMFAYAMANICMIKTDKRISIGRKLPVAVLFGGTLLYLCMGRINAANDKSVDNTLMCEEINKVEAYCAEHPENAYIVHNGNFAFKQDNGIFDVQDADNIIYFGGWITHSPLFSSQMENNGLDTYQKALVCQENVCYIDSDEENVKKIYDYIGAQTMNSKYTIETAIELKGIFAEQVSIYKKIEKDN